jgi:hypothetical protein
VVAARQVLYVPSHLIVQGDPATSAHAAAVGAAAAAACFRWNQIGAWLLPLLLTSGVLQLLLLHCHPLLPCHPLLLPRHLVWQEAASNRTLSINALLDA